ncbi:MAG: hypothetical protein WBB31_19050 [Saprospiraceae bacterium]
MENNVENIITYDEVQKQILSDNHEYIILPNAKDIGIIDASKAAENLSIIVERAKNALGSKFYIEFISLKIQYLEFFLRIFWVTKNPDRKNITDKDQKFFGTLINECKTFGFNTDLIDKINDFNTERIKAIHKFLMGATSESELKIICDKYSKLGNELQEYVINNCGQFIEDVTKLPQDTGTMIFTRPKRHS